MLAVFANLIESFRPPSVKEVFFPSLPVNRKILLWYAGRVVKQDSTIEGIENLERTNELRKKGQPLTFLCNHLTYADSHIIETLFIRFGVEDLASHLIHIAGQKTLHFPRRILTRSLNTIRVYQPKAKIDKAVKSKMNHRALKWAARQKRRGYSLLVFPEGTRTRSEKRFNLHAANPKTTIYCRSSLVVPLALMGGEEILPLGSFLPRPATVRLRVGEPVDHSAEEAAIRKEHHDITERELREKLMHHYMILINHLLSPAYQFEEMPRPQDRPNQVPGM
jgi:1-acyl-sn-glycerol-3-phosphate acyltransferase